jgi:hypothetical protein
MAQFETDAEVYDQLGGILHNLVGNTQRLQQLRLADAVVQFSFRSPDATVTLDVRAGKQARIELGHSGLRPDVVLAMDADTGHALLHGELNATVALARGDVRTKGPVAKVLRVVPATVGAHEVEADSPVEVAAVAPPPPKGPRPERAAAREADAAPEADEPEAAEPEPAEPEAAEPEPAEREPARVDEPEAGEAPDAAAAAEADAAEPQTADDV